MNRDGPSLPNVLRIPPPVPLTWGERATLFAKRVVTVGNGVVVDYPGRVRGRVLRSRAAPRLAAFAEPRRLCLGSGHAPIPGWINIDVEPPADVLLDLRFGIPVPNGTIDAIYSEHLVEHLSLEAASALFRECRRILKPGGVMRTATPDLEELVTDYRRDWRNRHDWINWPEYGYIDTPVRMINIGVREWGHQYLYDFDELGLRLAEAGFEHVERVALGSSSFLELSELETRADSRLIVEATVVAPVQRDVHEEAT